MKSIKKASVLKDHLNELFTEVNILKQLNHPNIVNIFELFQDKRHYYLITEYCSGGELFDRIKKEKYLSEYMAAEYIKQILSAIVYCHARNVVHRDLKPENLLLSNQGQTATIKVIDFGTSRRFNRDESENMT